MTNQTLFTFQSNTEIPWLITLKIRRLQKKKKKIYVVLTNVWQL